MSFKLGDKVRSKSSGLIMTVCRPRGLTVGGKVIGQVEAGKVCCEWYNKETGKYQTRFFDEEVLELYEEPKKERKKDIGY